MQSLDGESDIEINNGTGCEKFNNTSRYQGVCRAWDFILQVSLLLFSWVLKKKDMSLDQRQITVLCAAKAVV